jgi:hypothetical protein
MLLFKGQEKYKHFVELSKCLKRRMIKHYTPDWRRHGVLHG